MQDKKPLSLYIHIPFCRTRCGYCDFNTYAGKDQWIPEYMAALQQELIHFSSRLREEFFIHTIYFGGGTPSLISANHLRALFSVIRDNFDIIDQSEISLEANPNGLSKDYLEEVSEIGINRLSVGMQSAIPEELDILDRKHTLEDVQHAVMGSQESGILNINLDLIFSIPSQTMESLEESVNTAIDFNPTHLSIYGLILHEETVLFQKIKAGIIEPIDEDLGGDMYAWLMRYLPAKGFEQYEISNWAIGETYHGMHNLQYWHNLDYLGIGAGAHSHLRRYRWSNSLGIQSYISGVKKSVGDAFFHPAVDERVKLFKDDMVKETLMMGLRLTREGINIHAINERFGFDIDETYREGITKLLGRSLIELLEINDHQHMRLTEKGRMLGNQVFLEFI